MPTTTCDLCRTPLSADQLVTISGKTVCAKCKPDVVMNIKSGVTSSGRVSPERAQEIKKKISKLNILSFVLAVPGLLLQFGGVAMAGAAASSGEVESIPPILILGRLLAPFLIIAGLVCYSLMKGRSGLLGLLGLLSCIGLLILHFLPKKCHNCRNSAGYNAKDCGTCGAPV
jgi:hypothetical protein